MKCIWCGNPLTGQQTRYCSYLCCQKWKAKNNWRRDLDRQRKDKICLYCKENYKGTSEQQFCSHKCADIFRRREEDETRLCFQCGKTFGVSPHHRPQVFCSRLCADESKKKDLGIPPPSTAERKIGKLGYVWVHAPLYHGANKKGCVAEHRIVAEQKIGRRLKKNEVVHHINGIRWDNRPENLEVMDKHEHCRLPKKHR